MLIDFQNKKIFAISDTHGKHRNIIVPNADIIIHCGDVCSDGNMEEIIDFFSWFENLDIKNKIFVAGNHDLIFDLEPNVAKNLIPNNVILLENSSVIIDGIKFFSLAVRPYVNLDYKLEKDIDVLITHGPPFGILDEGIGCKILIDIVTEINPKLHIFGHIHSCSNSKEIHNNIQFFNTCISY